jgi:hypothetical protein
MGGVSCQRRTRGRHPSRQGGLDPFGGMVGGSQSERPGEPPDLGGAKRAQFEEFR